MQRLDKFFYYSLECCDKSMGRAYPIDFDDVWALLGFKHRFEAIHSMLSLPGFARDQDYVFHGEDIFITFELFAHWCTQAPDQDIAKNAAKHFVALASDFINKLP